MDTLRLRLMAGLAGITLAFAASAYAQNTNTPTTSAPPPTVDQATPPAQPQGTVSGSANTQAAPTGGATIGTESRTTTSATDVTTTTPTTTTFWLGPWGIAAIAVVAILLLWAIFGRRDRTVVRDSYSSTTTRGTAPTNERVVSPRAASGTETTTRVSDTDTRL